MFIEYSNLTSTTCTFNCPNCFNKETHDFDGGLEFDENAIDRILLNFILV